MRVRLDKVRDEPFRWDEVQSLAAAELAHPDLTELGPVHWSGEVRYTDPDFLLDTRYDYEQTLACTRCLAPVVQPVSGRLQLLVTTETPPADAEVALSEEELGTLYAPDEELELLPLLREQVELNVPMRALCRKDCRGLCPECGVNRNDEACDCVEDATDPRWAALAALRR